ncbi:hypothetical protein AAZX31_02G257900 [Glycine max]
MIKECRMLGSLVLAVMDAKKPACFIVRFLCKNIYTMQ